MAWAIGGGQHVVAADRGGVGVDSLIGGFTMVVGISTFAVVTAKVAEFLVRSPEASDRADLPP
jgi:hypothetical protein